MTLTRNEIETIVWSMLQDYITNDFSFEANQTQVVKKLLKELEGNGLLLILKIVEQYDCSSSRTHNFDRFIFEDDKDFYFFCLRKLEKNKATYTTTMQD